MERCFFFVLFQVFVVVQLTAQVNLSNNITIEKALTEIEKTEKVKFNYSGSSIKVDQKLKKQIKNQSLDYFLQYLYQFHDIKHTKSGSTILLFPEQEKRVKFVSGYIRDSITKEPLIFATIIDKETGRGVTANEYGYYVISTTKKSLKLDVSYVGYLVKKIDLDLSVDISRDILLTNNVQLKEFKVIESLNQTGNPDLASLGKIQLTNYTLEKSPMLKGENDPLRTMSLLPGVSSNESDSYLNIRGGNIGENLILIDGVTIYKMSHLRKLSIINGDVINKATLYKSNFPSRYNGRTSSIIDFRIKNGNQEKLKATGSIGFQTGKLMLDGPIGKNFTYVFSGRRNYSDFYNRLFANSFFENYFDLYAKLNYNYSNGNFSLSGFYDRDQSINKYANDIIVFLQDSSISIKEEKFDHVKTSYSGLASLQWNHKWNKKLFTNYQLAFYDYAIQSENRPIEPYYFDSSKYFSSNSHIQDVVFNMHHELKEGDHMMSFGFNNTYHNLFSIFETDTNYLRDNKIFNELNIYFEDKYNISDKTNLRIGANVVGYFIEDSLKPFKSIFSLNPRAEIIHSLNKRHTFSVSYSRMSQFLHLIPFNISSGYQSEIWQASTSNYPPANGNHFSISYVTNFLKQFSVSLESYLKIQEKEKNVQNSDLELLFFGIESTSFNGIGSNYGIEFLIEKRGQLSGWLSYSLSKSLKKFNEINNGNSYLSSYDRTHVLNLMLQYQINDKITVAGTWQLKGGTPFYLKYSDQIDLDTNLITNYNKQKYIDVTQEQLIEGSYWRYPNFNEVNIQLSFKKKKKWGIREWQIGMKNLFINKEFVNPAVAFDQNNYSIIFRWHTPQFGVDFYPYLTYRFKIN